MPRGGTAANRQASKQFEALEPRRLLAASGYDASFGGGSGWIGTEVPIPTGTTPVAAFQQADGKIIASAGSGDQGLVRFNVDGSLDETFGQHGRVNGRSCLYIRAIARLSDGKILVVGHETSQNGFRVTRVNSDGSIDSSFGTGGSVNITVPQMASGYADITSVAVDSLGRIVVLGDEWSTGYPDLFIVRLTADGTPDTTFSGDGIAILQQPDSQHAGSMLLQADGRIIIASRPYGTNVVARFNVDGTQDMAFGSGGYLTLPSGFSNVNAMALDASGRLLLTGEGYGVASGYNAAVARYSAEGQLDASFGVGGQRSFSFYTNAYADSDPYAVAVDGLGRILVGGVAETSPGRFAVARLTASGNLDTSFDGDGRAWADIAPDGGRCLFLGVDASNRVTGIGVNSTHYSGDMTLVRFTSTGAKDTTFDSDGIAMLKGTWRGDDGAVAVARQDDGKLLVLGGWSGYTSSYQYYSALTRFNADGSVDESYGQFGTIMLNGVARGMAISGGKAVVLTHLNLYRFNADGSPDTSFSGDGKLTPPTNTTDTRIVADSLGRIYVGGSASYLTLTRFTADGNPDTTYDGDGTLALPGPGTGQSARGLVIQPDDKVLVASGDRIWRVRPDATIDSNFAGGAGAAASGVTSFELAADGSILLGDTGPGDGGTYSWDVNLRRLDGNGNPDMSFGSAGGIAVANVMSGGQVETVKAIATYPDGTSVLAVELHPYGSGSPDPGSALVQFTPQGQLDPAFDGDGILFIPASPTDGQPYFTADAAIDPQGRILALGHRWTGAGTPYWNSDIVLARFNGRHDAFAPRVMNVALLDDAAQLRLRYEFDDDVGASLDLADLELRPLDAPSAQPITPQSFTFDGTTMTALAVFAAGNVRAGAYRATLRGDGIRDGADNPLANDHHLDLIFVPAGETLTLPDGAMIVHALSIGGTLDVGGGAVIVNYGSVSPVGVWTGSAYDGVGGMIQQGRIVSSAASGMLRTVGVAEARDALNLTGTQTASFAGQAVDSTSVLIKLTWGGDANLDGKINIDDYGRIDGNVAQSGSVFGWFNGDFNFDGKINIDDYGIIDGNIHQQDEIL